MSTDAKRMTVYVPYKGREYIIYLTTAQARRFAVAGILSHVTDLTAGKADDADLIIHNTLTAMATRVKETNDVQ